WEGPAEECREQRGNGEPIGPTGVTGLGGQRVVGDRVALGWYLGGGGTHGRRCYCLSAVLAQPSLGPHRPMQRHHCDRTVAMSVRDLPVPGGLFVALKAVQRFVFRNWAAVLT